ncbi:MAG: hypothetical protein IJE44_00235 [Clostridia bacterium]|nr:hypothetical protein [Clostridia bacterium]
MAEGELLVGFELYDALGYIERLDPLKIHIDSFISLGGENEPNVYVVTASVGEVKTLTPGKSAYVKNTGTSRDLVLEFGIPKGEKGAKGDRGDKGDAPIKGVDYYTAEERQEVLLEFENEIREVSYNATRDKADSLNITTEILKSGVINDSSKSPLVRLSIYGESSQEDNAFPSSPVDIVSIENPAIMIGDTSLTIPYTLRGLKNKSGVFEARDEIVIENNTVKFIKRCEKYIVSDAQVFGFHGETAKGLYRSSFILNTLRSGKQSAGYINILPANKHGWDTWISETIQIGQLNNVIYFITQNEYSASKDLYNYLSNNGENEVYIIYQLAEPIVTDITETECGKALLSLETSYPNTEFSCPADLKITYRADTTNAYYNTKSELDTLKQAIINLGGTI